MMRRRMRLGCVLRNGKYIFPSIPFYTLLEGVIPRMQEIIKAVAVGIFTIIMAVINQCDEG